MLKGKAKLTLRDAKNGLILFQEEHHNTVTPAIERIFTSNIAGTLNINSLCPIYSKLLGGVCLFDSTLSTTDIFLPTKATTQLTAHAGQDYNASFTQVDSKVGQPDGQLSGEVENGYKWVWNWSNLQGNGTIASIALTHKDTGSYWNEDLEANVMSDYFCPIERVDNKIINPSPYSYQFLDVDYPYIDNFKSIPIGFYGDINHIVSLEQYTSTKIKIHIAEFTGNGCWLWNNVGDIHDVSAVEFTPLHARYYLAYDGANGLLYFIYVGTDDTPRGKSVRIDTYNLSTNTFTSKVYQCEDTIKNYTGSYVDPDDSVTVDKNLVWCDSFDEAHCPKQLQIVNNSIYVPLRYYKNNFEHSAVDCSIRLSLSDVEEMEIVKNFYKMQWYLTSYKRDQVQIDLGNNRLMNPQTMTWKDENNLCVGQPIVYDETNLFLTQTPQTRAYCAKQLVDSPIQYFTFVGEYNSSGVRGTILNKLFKATAFNLESPVVKTAAMTMSLEYTLYQQTEPSNTEEENEQTE